MPGASFQRQLHRNPRMVVGTFLVLMIACVLGLVAWKASSAREAALGQARGNLENLTRSLGPACREHVQGARCGAWGDGRPTEVSSSPRGAFQRLSEGDDARDATAPLHR